VIEKEGGDVAAVISETIRSTPYVPPYEYWKEVRKICDENNVVLIIDEIPHCLGRTGKMFTFQHYDILPDILVIGKSLGGGIVPIAATVAKREMDVMGHRAIGHYTHEKNPVLCAAALATIQYIEENKLVENAAIQGEYALKRLNEMKDEHKLIGDVRGKGLLLGIELVKDHKKKTRAIDEAEAVMYRCLEKGLSFKLTMGNILTLTPPLTITREEMDKALDIIDESIHEIEQQTT
ncbi:aspartate aminotransferase family protein, partial [Candidatus Bathyarchaeota archaeon]